MNRTDGIEGRALTLAGAESTVHRLGRGPTSSSRTVSIVSLKRLPPWLSQAPNFGGWTPFRERCRSRKVVLQRGCVSRLRLESVALACLLLPEYGGGSHVSMSSHGSILLMDNRFQSNRFDSQRTTSVYSWTNHSRRFSTTSKRPKPTNDKMRCSGRADSRWADLLAHSAARRRGNCCPSCRLVIE